MKNEDEVDDSQFNKMKIDEQNVVCPDCGGIGSIRVKTPWSRYNNYRDGGKIQCPRCKGKGQLDWISSIMDKKEGAK